MTTLLEALTKAIEAKDEAQILENLKLTASEDIRLADNSLIKSLISLKNDKTAARFTETAAEWCKNEHNRKIFTDKDTIDYFVKMLEKEESLVLGSIRVLGNICYENEEARKLIDKKGLSVIISILEADANRKNNLLTLKVSGLLVNLLMSNEDLQRTALTLKITEVIDKVFNKYLAKFNENQMLFAFLLTVLNHVLDYDEQNVFFTETLCCTIVDIFKSSTMPDIAVLCLEILHGQSEKDNIKLLLAKKGICELVFDLIEKYRSQVIDEESRSVMKMACDMIVIILTEDQCMYLLYNNGEGKLYKNMLTWLDSDDPDLLSTGVLALGNFARKDTHCIQMIQNGISKRLIALLSKNNTIQSDIKVQHALLSTLKNLLIPPQNKAIVLEEGLIDVIYPIIHTEHYLVVFKLLGTFRMLIDGQEKPALELISRREFLEKLMHWCYNSDHLGVRGEVPRLLSWLIKHCHSFKPFKSLLQVKDSVKCLVEMCSSNHAVMQNESFYALNLLCIGCGVSNETNGSNGVCEHTNEDTESLYKQLVEADIGKNLNFVVARYGDKMEKQTIENLLELIEQLLHSSLVVEHLKSSNVAEALAGLKTNSNCISERLDDVLSQINK